jgi:hypothetical protein
MCGDGDHGRAADIVALGGTSATPIVAGGNGGIGSATGQDFLPQPGSSAAAGTGSAGGGGGAGRLRVNTLPGGFSTALFAVTAVPTSGPLSIQ